MPREKREFIAVSGEVARVHGGGTSLKDILAKCSKAKAVEGNDVPDTVRVFIDCGEFALDREDVVRIKVRKVGADG